MKIRAMLTALFCALTGCSNLDQLVPGKSRADEVISLLGEPSMRWHQADGSELWEYAGVPSFEENRMMIIGRNRVLLEMRNPLVQPFFDQIKPGMSQDAVRQILGRPLTIQKFPRLEQEVWDWRIEDQSHRGDMRFNAHFNPSGQLVEVSRQDLRTE